MNKKVWIHCRVSNYTDRSLLDYQKELLSSFAKQNNLEVVGITKEISKGLDPFSTELKTIRTHIYRNKINFILVYDRSRILIHDDLFVEFQMLCDQKLITIIDLQSHRNLPITDFLACL